MTAAEIKARNMIKGKEHRAIARSLDDDKQYSQC